MIILELSKVLTKFQVTLPKDVREKLQISLGEKVAFIESKEGFIIKKVTDEFVNDLTSGIQVQQS